MKFRKYYTGYRKNKEIVEINTLEELLKCLEEEEEPIIIFKRDFEEDYDKEEDPNVKYDIEIYDNYRE